MTTRFCVALVAAAATLAAGPLQAAVVCTGPGYPPGCVAVEATPARVVTPGGPVVNPSPGVGYGARGAGLRPAAGPGVGPNAGGPVNRPGYR
jgi:hypothetical protein